jgi:hypothetical protein
MVFSDLETPKNRKIILISDIDWISYFKFDVWNSFLWPKTRLEPKFRIFSNHSPKKSFSFSIKGYENGSEKLFFKMFCTRCIKLTRDTKFRSKSDTNTFYILYVESKICPILKTKLAFYTIFSIDVINVSVMIHFLLLRTPLFIVPGLNKQKWCDKISDALFRRVNTFII